MSVQKITSLLEPPVRQQSVLPYCALVLTVESQGVALIAPLVTHAQVSDVLPIRLLSVVSCLCNNLRPHLTSSAGPRKARLSLEDLQPTLHHQHQRSRLAARQAAENKDAHRAPCPAAQRLGTVPGRAGLSTSFACVCV